MWDLFCHSRVIWENWKTSDRTEENVPRNVIPCSKSSYYLKCNWIFTILLRFFDLVTLFSNLSLDIGAFTVFPTPTKKGIKNFSWAPFVLTNGCYIGPYNRVYDFILWWTDGLFCLNFVMLTYLEGKKPLIAVDIGVFLGPGRM